MASTIRMVSEEIGKQIRETSDKRAAELRSLLVGARVMDVNFKSVWLNNRPVEGLVLEKEDGRMFLLTAEAEGSWEGSVLKWIEVMDVKTREILSDNAV
jgi:hypothetical protein